MERTGERNGAAVFGRIAAITLGDNGRGGLRQAGAGFGFDGLEGERADGDVAVCNRMSDAKALSLVDLELIDESINRGVVGVLEGLLLFCGERAEELLEILGVVVLRPSGGVELDLLVSFDAVVDGSKRRGDEACQRLNLGRRRHLERGVGKRQAAERALIAQSIKKAEVVAYDDLGTEAIRKLEVENFPAVVLIDCEGNDLYEIGQAKYREI